jgi:hypothetical protein
MYLCAFLKSSGVPLHVSVGLVQASTADKTGIGVEGRKARGCALPPAKGASLHRERCRLPGGAACRCGRYTLPMGSALRVVFGKKAKGKMVRRQRM